MGVVPRTRQVHHSTLVVQWISLTVFLPSYNRISAVFSTLGTHRSPYRRPQDTVSVSVPPSLTPTFTSSHFISTPEHLHGETDRVKELLNLFGSVTDFYPHPRTPNFSLLFRTFSVTVSSHPPTYSIVFLDELPVPILKRY